MCVPADGRIRETGYIIRRSAMSAGRRWSVRSIICRPRPPPRYRLPVRRRVKIFTHAWMAADIRERKLFPRFPIPRPTPGLTIRRLTGMSARSAARKSAGPERRIRTTTAIRRMLRLIGESARFAEGPPQKKPMWTRITTVYAIYAGGAVCPPRRSTP